MATILGGLVSTVIEKLVTKVFTEIASMLHVKCKIKELKTKLEKIQRLLEDAESKIIETKSIKFWFAEFREVVYDTEDLVDDFQDHAAKVKATSKTERVKEKLKYVLGISLFRRRIANRIKNINSKLEGLYLESQRLGLVESLADKNHPKVCSDSRSQERGTISIQLDSDIVGINDDATELADQIMYADTEKTHSVFAIVGMGGIGKSTLASKVFNLDNIKQHFEKTVWVSVSKNRNGKHVLYDIVRGINDKYKKNCSTCEELSRDFVKTVQGKRVFIVLDGVWDKCVWENFLRLPLLTGAKYSRILITTRYEKVAKEMDVAKPYQMKLMPLEVGWLLLKKNVCREGDDVMNDQLEEIGKKIVEKCEYLPLSIKTVGGVLKTKDRSTRVWEEVLKDEIWSMHLDEDVKASLLLSYEDLPPHLKRCFTYFSVLPRVSFQRYEIMNLWIAEGLVEKKKGKDVEESGGDYYDELMMRNLLQSKPMNKYKNGCTIHDLVHSLALFVSKKEYIYVQEGDSIKLRHLCFSNKDLDAVPEEIMNQDYARNLFLKRNPHLKTIKSEHLSHLRRLRVLDLSETGIEELPDEIGSLLQLKYLDISDTKLKELPESIKNLKSLETLYTYYLKDLHELPTGITELINLRVFVVASLRSMPPGMCNMKNLRCLRDFVVSEVTEGGSQSTTNIKELEGLSLLTDLCIRNLEKVASKEEAEVAKIGNKASLKHLILESNYQEDRNFDDGEIEKNKEVFTGIMVPIDLKEFMIDGFIGREFPSHIFKSLGQLTYLVLDHFRLITQLPCLGDLPNLEKLVIVNAPLVTELGPEFFGSSKFPKLQFLEMVKMKKIEKMFEVEEGAFPCLEKLYIRECPKLKSLKEGWQHAKCLKTLEVEKLENLESIENFNSLCELTLKSNSRLTSVKNLPSLKKLKAFHCPSLREVKDVGKNELFLWAENIQRRNALHSIILRQRCV